MKKILTGIITVLVVSIIVIYVLVFMPKFKNITISTGTNTINVDDLLRLNIFKNKAKLVTNVENLDFNSVGTKDIVVSYGNNDYLVKVNVIDDVSPDLVIKNVDKTLNYKINVNDFVESVFDHSE